MPQQARPKDIRIICGLGNPGPEYASTRHNAGFATVDALAERHGARYWKSEAGCMVARCTMRAPEGTREVLLAKPQDYMNTSGGPLSKLTRTTACAPSQTSSARATLRACALAWGAHPERCRWQTTCYARSKAATCKSSSLRRKTPPRLQSSLSSAAFRPPSTGSPSAPKAPPEGTVPRRRQSASAISRPITT